MYGLQQGLASAGPACQGYQLDIRIQYGIQGEDLLVVARLNAEGCLWPYLDDTAAPVVIPGQGHVAVTVKYPVVLVAGRSAPQSELRIGDSVRVRVYPADEGILHIPYSQHFLFSPDYPFFLYLVGEVVLRHKAECLGFQPHIDVLGD